MPRSISSTVHPGARAREAGDGVGDGVGTKAGVAVAVTAGAASEEGAAVEEEAAPEQAAERANRKMPNVGNKRFGTRLFASTSPLLFCEQGGLLWAESVLHVQLDDVPANRVSNVAAGGHGLAASLCPWTM